VHHARGVMRRPEIVHSEHRQVAIDVPRKREADEELRSQQLVQAESRRGYCPTPFTEISRRA
jgi:hypothetical protein